MVSDDPENAVNLVGSAALIRAGLDPRKGADPRGTADDGCSSQKDRILDQCFKSIEERLKF